MGGKIVIICGKKIILSRVITEIVIIVENLLLKMLYNWRPFAAANSNFPLNHVSANSPLYTSK